MKIGLIKRSFRLQGGGERQIGYLIEGLLARGHEVALFSQHPPPQKLAGGLSWHAVAPWPGPPALRALGFALRVRAVLRRVDLTLAQSFDRTLGQQIYRAGEGVHREWLARKRQTVGPFARGWTHVRPLDRVMLALERRILTETPLIIANSLQGKRDIMRHYGTPDPRITVIYNGVDLARFHPGVRDRFRDSLRAMWGVPSDAIVLLFVGSGFHRKGLDLLVEALGRLRLQGFQNMRAIVVGRGRIRRYQRLAARLAVADWVRFEGFQSEVERYYAAADLFVLPTRYDPFANACLEAMACGLPVLTTDANGAAELLQAGVQGSVLKAPLDVEALASALRALLPEAPRRMWAEAGPRIAREYSLSNMLAQTLRVYEATAGQGPITG
jgi:UDP-glucose:(heptosyl)LPS alpha-1,3-glucosyltransferase